MVRVCPPKGVPLAGANEVRTGAGKYETVTGGSPTGRKLPFTEAATPWFKPMPAETRQITSLSERQIIDGHRESPTSTNIPGFEGGSKPKFLPDTVRLRPPYSGMLPGKIVSTMGASYENEDVLGDEPATPSTSTVTAMSNPTPLATRHVTVVSENHCRSSHTVVPTLTNIAQSDGTSPEAVAQAVPKFIPWIEIVALALVGRCEGVRLVISGISYSKMRGILEV